MSTRQKSFFDQNHTTTKGRQSWQRSKSAQYVSRDNFASKDLKMNPAPLAASSQSKAKLKAFAFAAPEEGLASKEATRRTEEDKENHVQLDETDQGVRTGQDPPSTQEKIPTRTPGPPRTPASRLPLADLLANSEDSAARGPKHDTSPDERVIWQHNKSPNSSLMTSSLLTPGPSSRKAKKRARSSSPVLSPHDGHSRATVDSEPLDLQALQKSLKTPQANPAEELWKRYAVNTGDKRPPALPLAPAFRHLAHPSSPRSSKNELGGTVGLRRTASCGIEWPTSKAKRRKLSVPDVEGDVIGAPPPTPHDHAHPQRKSKLSRVSLLVERIQETLAQPPAKKELSSSSPLPERASDPSAALESPCKRPGPADVQRTEPALVVPERVVEDPPDDEHPTSANGGSSDFGDFDDNVLEAGLLEVADQTITKEAPCLEPPLDGLAVDDASHETRQVADRVESRLAPNSIPAVATASTSIAIEAVPADMLDDFDDIGDDDYGADLESMMMEFDTRSAAVADQAKETGPAIDRGIEGSSLPSMSALEGIEAEAVQQGAVKAGIPPESQEDKGHDSDDEFGDLGEVDFDLATAGNSVHPRDTGAPSSSKKQVQAIKRYLITDLSEGRFETSQGQSRPEKTLIVQDEKTKSTKLIVLRQSWFDTPCTVGAYVHLIGDFAQDGRCVIDDAQNMLILHPDHLISSTVVADSFGCTRRAVLQDRVKATNEASPPQVYGHILHEIMQEAMRANRWDTDWLGRLIEDVVLRFIESIYEIKLEVAQAVDYLKGKMPELQGWAELFISAKPQAGAYVQDRHGKQALLSINKLLDVEEHIWSPMYGLKGNIDATVQVALDDEGGRKTLTVPFELKTGRNANASHRAQTALYTLLLSDRYEIDVAFGILYYMETSEISRIPAIRHELRHMVMQRNELACYVRGRLELPSMLKSPHLCGKCYAKTPCFIYHKLMDDGDGETSGMGSKFDEVVRHLKPEHQAFFKLWDDLLTKEEKDMLKFRRELWTMLSSERERLGRCFSNVVIEPGSAHEAENAPKINKFRYTLVKQTPKRGFSFIDSQITVGEPIVISDEKGHFALANGYVTHVRRNRITVAVDRRLHNARVRRRGFDAEDNQVFAGVMEVMEVGAAASTVTANESDEQTVYRLDKDEFSNGMATVRNNLIQVMSNEVFGSREIRELVVEGRAPTFKAASTAYAAAEGPSQTRLNVDQKRAIEKVMSAKDYALVLGMPGTGKTTTIAHIIRALVSQGKSVLLTSYTHTAVDNILLKIRDDKIGILRLGALAKIHPEVQDFAILAATPKTSVEELRNAYHGPQVVATTCLGVNHAVFNERIFDYCVVDEASQITLPVCLGPIRMAKAFVLVGDHNQLPPLVQNVEARQGGLDVSLFKLLSDRQPGSVVNLEHQYRMCEDIMTLSNTLIYDGLLKCGTAAVASRALSLPSLDKLSIHHRTSASPSSTSHSHSPLAAVCPSTSPIGGECWLRTVLDPSKKVCFLNTDALLPAARESAKGSRIVNATEASLCAQLVEALLTSGAASSDLGIISIYRSQVALLRDTLRHIPHASSIEMHTADKFQGRDKELIILSLVRSNDAAHVGDLLRDWRRINVALTRARSKLLILGSADTLSRSTPLLAKMLGLMRARRWVLDLPAGADAIHVFDAAGGVTQKSSPLGSPSRRSPAGIQPRMRDRKENVPPSSGRKRASPKKGTVSSRAILGARPVLRDILNELAE